MKATLSIYLDCEFYLDCECGFTLSNNSKGHVFCTNDKCKHYGITYYQPTFVLKKVKVKPERSDRLD